MHCYAHKIRYNIKQTNVSKFPEIFLIYSNVPVNSCLRLLCSVNGESVTTVEGIGSQKTGFNPVQVRYHNYFFGNVTRNVSQKEMGPSAVFALQEWLCPCTRFCKRIPTLPTNKLKIASTGICAGNPILGRG
jgi:hypothetical protein